MHQLISRATRVATIALCVLGAWLPAQSSGRTVAGQTSRGQQVVPGPDQTAPGAGVAPVEGFGEVGTGHVGFRLGFYDNGDSGDGNPFLDESLTVIEPVAFFDYNVSRKTNVWGKFSYDNVSSASIDRLSNFPDQSGASGDYYFGLEGGATWALDADTRIGAFLHGSAEYDYRSFGIGGSYARDYDDDSTTLKWTGSLFFDNLDVIRFNGVEEGSDNRTSLNLGGSWYQVLSARTHAETGIGLTLQNGFLSTPYNAVVVEDPSLPPNSNLVGNARGLEGTEVLPDTRARLTLYGRVRHLWTDNLAAELGGRLYGDDWGVSSVTLEPAAIFWIVPEVFRARVGYRFYTQTAADSYQARYPGTDPAMDLPEFRTQDADLGAFSSHALGLRFDWFTSPTTRWDLTFDYQSRDDGLDYFFGSIGWTTNF